LADGPSRVVLCRQAADLPVVPANDWHATTWNMVQTHGGDATPQKLGHAAVILKAAGLALVHAQTRLGWFPPRD
jgi:hypothetical protein